LGSPHDLYKIVNLAEWEGVAGQPAKKLGTITYDRFATFDEEQANNAVAYIKAHAVGDQPFFMIAARFLSL
jgi:hypothetical protein